MSHGRLDTSPPRRDSRLRMPFRRSPVSLRVIFAIAAVLTVFSSLMAIQLKPPGQEVSNWELVLRNGFYWATWAAVAPFIIWLAQRFPFEQRTWRRALGVHAVAAVALSQLHILGSLSLHRGLSSYFERPLHYPFWPALQRWAIQNTDWEMMTYWAIVGAALAVTYQRQARDRAIAAAKLETKLIEAQLQTLQSQLHPHFLFNTLHAISALIHRDPDAADRTLAQLAELLRITLDNVGEQEVTLAEELEFLDKYLQIEQTRFRDRLTVKLQVEPETLHALVPWMVLQPLVENAIKHGIAPRPEPGTVEISARRSGDRLVLDVSDDGVGLTRDALAALQAGIGVSTTRARLAYQFGRAYQFEFLRQARGLTVRIGIPWRPAPEAARPSVA
jgi:two-component system, LytTR family, sensor kinase